MPNEVEDKKLISKRELADMLGITTAAINRHRQRHGLECVYIGNKAYYTMDDAKAIARRGFHARSLKQAAVLGITA